MSTHLSPREQGHHNIAKNRQIKTGLWTVLSLALAFFGVLILSTIDTPSGEPWLETSAVAQTLTTLGLIVAAVLPSLLGTRRDSAVVREQVQNSHAKNQRDDMDDKHDTVIDLITAKFDAHNARMDDRFSAVTSDIRGVRRDIGRSADDIREIRSDHKQLQRKLEAVAIQVELDTETGELHIVKHDSGTVDPNKEES